MQMSTSSRHTVTQTKIQCEESKQVNLLLKTLKKSKERRGILITWPTTSRDSIGYGTTTTEWRKDVLVRNN